MAGRPQKLFQTVTIEDFDGSTRDVVVKDELIRLAQTGAKPGIICDFVGVHRDSLRNWLHWGNPAWQPTSDHDHAEVPADRAPFFAFFEEWKRATARPALVAEAAWLKAAREGDWRATKEWLKAHRSDEFSEDVNIHHQGSVNMTHDINKVLEDYADAFNNDDEDNTE